MPPQEKLSKDDPQIHLLAAKYCEKIREINPESINDEEVKVLISCIQFFAHYIKYLPECVNDVLRMCKSFLIITKNESITFDVAAINRIVGICTVMLIRRREEDVIRCTCVVLKEVLDIIPSSTLKVIVTKYAKTLTFIFQKLYVVQTYFTQLRILEIFVYITKDLPKLLTDTVSKHHLLRNAKEETKQIVFEKISKIDLKDVEISSRKFLRFYNNNLFPKTCILSVEGRMFKMNGHSIKQNENMLVNFNGRNLTISFFIPNSVFSSHESPEKESDYLIFIEFECKSISSHSKEYKGRPYVDVMVDVSQAATYNPDMTRESLDEIESISLRLIDDDATLKKFSESFYEKFKQNERMMNDQASCIDKMSIMTFQTSASLLNSLKTMNEAKSQLNLEIKTQDLVKKDEIPKIEKIKSLQVKPREGEPVFDNLMLKKETAAPKKAIPVETKQSQPKARPKRQSAKKAQELLSDIYDEDNMDDEGKISTSYRDFKAQQKKKEVAKTADKLNVSQDSNRNYYLEPVEIITRTTLKSKTTKFNKYESKPKHYDTDEENHEVKRNVRPKKQDVKKQELKVQQPKTRQRKAKEPKERMPLTNIETVKNVIKDKIDVKSAKNKEQKPVQQNQKRKLPENPKPLMDDDDIEMEEPPVKIVNQTNKNHKISDDSIASGRSPTPVFYKEKPAIKRPKPVDNQDEVPCEKRRRLTIDNVFDLVQIDKELPKQIGVTTKVENWLKSTSDSFSLDMSLDHVDPEIPAIQKAPQVISAVPKNAQNEDADNESEMSYGQFANDEHQHYSSSSHESMDLDVKKLPTQHKKVSVVAAKKPKLAQKNEHENPLTSCQVDNAPQNEMPQNNRFKDPANNFKIRVSEAKVELILRKKKIDDNDKNARKVYDQKIAKIGQKCLEQSLKIKTQLKQVHQLHLRYESAKSKLNDDITEQDKWIVTLNREIEKRDDALKGHNQNMKKELMKLKNDAINKNEELMQDIWCDYVDNFQTRLNSTIQKAYDL